MALKPRMVVVGLGSIGRRHARLLAGRADLEVEWCEPSEPMQQLAAQSMAPPRVHREFAAMLETKPDMVVLATPHAFHADQAVASLNAGIHVLCEKPMADTLAGAERMARAAGKSRAILNIGFHLHFHPALRRMKEVIQTGEIGKVLHVHCHVGSYITLVNSASRYQRTLEGALLLDYAHQPDLLAWLLGETPTGVYALGGMGGGLEFQSNPNFIAVTCDYARPLISTVHLNYLQMPERHTYEIVGDRGWLGFDFNSGLLRMGRQATSEEWEERFTLDRDSLYQAEHAAFLQAVAGRVPPESPAASALISMRVIDAALRSLKSRQREKIT